MNQSKQTRSGSAILVVLGIVTIVSIVCGFLGITASQQMRMAQVTRETLKAKLIAESGLNRAFHLIRNNFSQATSLTCADSFCDGNYTVTAHASTENPNRVQLISKGTCGLGIYTVAIDVENRPIITTSDPEDRFFTLTYDFVSGGTLSLSGNFGASVTKLHANGSVSLKGSSATDATTISSAGTITIKKSSGTMTTVEHADAVEILTAALSAAINELKNYAKQNNAIYASGCKIPASPPGGIAWCTGSSDGWTGSGTGCFIFDGSFTTKHMTISSEGGYPALIVTSQNDVKINAGTTITGAVLLPTSSLKLNGHALIEGPLVVGQSVSGNGTADLLAGDGQGFNLPPRDASTDHVVITAWH